MTCPNCNSAAGENAHFCQNCGFRFDEIRQVEPIRIDISQPAESPPIAIAAPPVVPTVIVREKKSGATTAIVALTILTTLLIVGAAGLLAFYLLTRPAAHTEIVQANANQISANSTVAAASPQPTTYEDLKNKLAPPDKRTGLMDESFTVESDAPRRVEFEITQTRGARVVGGLRVLKGSAINFLIVRVDVDGESSAEELAPLAEQTNTRNKIVNQRLKPGLYALVFTNDNNNSPATVAAEFFVVED